MLFEFPKKVKENNNKLFKKTSYDIRAYVGEIFLMIMQY